MNHSTRKLYPKWKKVITVLVYADNFSISHEPEMSYSSLMLQLEAVIMEVSAVLVLKFRPNPLARHLAPMKTVTIWWTRLPDWATELDCWTHGKCLEMKIELNL